MNCKSAGFITRLVYHNLFVKNSSLNYVNRCGPKYRPPSYDSSFGQLVTALMLSVVGLLWTVKILLSCRLSITKNATAGIISNQPIACPSDQQADHVIR